MAAAKPQKLYRIKSPFHAFNVPYVDKRLIFPEDDPAVKLYFDCFEEIEIVGYPKAAPVVETTTANPGEQRTTARGRAADATE